ncbi:TraR/DksA family transcriptional regulator [Rarobacter incanus]|uniref:DnaK suppressor protein n=1 Tax=Rarobacter incanus TaxID=153494 RepID=A0A542SLZ6_9MICO|nr:TraR/DksA family transcriptional regulator [Rarobacter incanus]TQK75505.1 DnaK suppressor protein [Rarobacter incanus]
MTTDEKTGPRDTEGRLRGLTKEASKFPVRDGEQPWTGKELGAVVHDLVAASSRLATELGQADKSLSELLRNSGDGAGDDQADSGSSALEREHELSMINNLRALAAQNARAIERLEDGTYGQCENCGNAIGKARLMAFPRATLCVACKQREERR